MFFLQNNVKRSKSLASYTATTKEPKAVMAPSCLKITSARNSDIGLVRVGKIGVAGRPALCRLWIFPHLGNSMPGPRFIQRGHAGMVRCSFSTTKSVTAHVQHPKSNRIGGEKVEVFEFNGHNCCPVRALCNLKACDATPFLDQFCFSGF
jgi:hypothetical protein